MSEEAIRIECPGCHRNFRMRSRPNKRASAVKCPNCKAKIPLPGTAAPSATAPKPAPEPKKSDAELRKMLRAAKKKRDADDTLDADQTDQNLDIPDETTQPDIGAVTLPVGRRARRAEEFGTAAPTGPRQESRRPRVDTPRAGERVPPPTPPVPTSREIERRPSQSALSPQAPARPPAPEIDEPTYTGPAPGRPPRITPTDDDLSRFLEPGNYLVRVEDVVYAPVDEQVLAELIDTGIIVAVDEIAPENGEWQPLGGGGLLADVKARLAHRAHHVLSRVATARPAAEFGRPPEENEIAGPTAGADADATLPPTPDFGGATEDQTVDAEEDAGVDEENHASAVTAPERKRGGFLFRSVLVLLFLGTVAAGVAIVRPQTVDEIRNAIAPPPEPPPEPVVVAQAPVEPQDMGVDMAPPDPTPAFQSALATVASAHAVADSIDGLLKGALEQGDEQSVTTLSWMKWLREPTGVDSIEVMHRLMKRGDWKQARQIANWIIATEGETEELHDLVNETLRRQFDEETLVEITTDRFTKVVAVDPGRRPALVLADKDGGRWRIWPDLGEDGWRGDIAVYRLCQVMVCHYSIPETRAMRINRKTWRELQKASPPEVAEMMKRLRSDFDWQRKQLRGSIREVPEGARWPVEASGIWRPWLTAGDSLTKLDQDVVQAHHGVAFFEAERVYPEVENITARQLARQVSTMLLVDYLVGNWNRFAPTKDDWGSRTTISDGLIHSLDDSAAFLGSGSQRVKARFTWASRFSRAAVESLERLKPEEVDPLLFPDPSKDEKEKLEQLWKQRQQALRRINKLIKKYGADDVYALDAKPTKPTRQ